MKLDVDDIRRLGEAAPFAWSTYDFKRDGDLYVYRQAIGPRGRDSDAGDAGWNGREIVAFRLHLPSEIRYHNSGRRIGRGNILAWEQPLAERLRGTPLVLDARMDPAVDPLSHVVAVRLDVRRRRDHVRASSSGGSGRQAPAEKRAA